MPGRRRLPARLKVRPARADRAAVYVIVDGKKEISTGVREGDIAAAENAHQAYLARAYQAPRSSRLQELLIDDVVGVYLRDHAPTKRSSEWIAHTAAPILDWWSGKPLSAVNKTHCRAYVTWRTSQRVKAFKKTPGRLVGEQTARHELKTLRAAINFYHGHEDYGPLQSVPKVELPEKAPQKYAYFWTLHEADARLEAASARPDTQHLARLILIGLYSGTRPGAILKLRWLASTFGGWIDVAANLLYRRAEGAVETKKRQTPAPLHHKLRPLVRIWRDADMARGITSVIHFDGAPVHDVRRSWHTVRRAAGHDRRDGPHVLRHTAATWLMQAGVDFHEAAGYLGMSIETLSEVYAHHHPSHQQNAARFTPGLRVNQE